MDAVGVDVQVLSLTAPGLEQFDAATATALSKKTNDLLAEAIQRHPDRFMGFAALAPKNPEEAADELERAVRELGFKGWNTHSNYGDSYLDNKNYWPILERAEKLDVPVYLALVILVIIFPEIRRYPMPKSRIFQAFFCNFHGCKYLFITGTSAKAPG